MASGCSSTVDLGGVYRVDANVVSAPCGNDQPVATPPAALQLIADETFGFVYTRCTDEAGTMCARPNPYTDSFPEPIDDGWRGIVTTAGGGTTCTLEYAEQSATLHGTLLVVEITTYRDNLDGSTVTCSPDEAERRGRSMPCTAHERLEATKP